MCSMQEEEDEVLAAEDDANAPSDMTNGNDGNNVVSGKKVVVARGLY